MAKKPAKKPNTDLTGSCFNCGKPLTQDDYCFGCKEYICDKCDANGVTMPPGRHEPTDHLDWDADDDLTDDERDDLD